MSSLDEELQGFVQELLLPDEKIGLVVSEQRYAGASLIAPARVFATNKRIIVAKQDVFRWHRSFKIIKYDYITDIKLAKGIRYCKIHFGLQGEQVEDDGRKWITGLEYADAIKLIHFINHVDVRIPAEQVSTNKSPRKQTEQKRIVDEELAPV